MPMNAERQLRRDAVKVFVHPKGDRRVVIFRRADRTFDFEEERFLAEEDSWVAEKKSTASVIDTLDRAILEVTDRVDWLKKL